MNMRPPSSLALATPRGGRPPAARQGRFRGGKLGQYRTMLGFTLIEMMITVVIMGILVAVALPSYNAQVARTRRASASGCAMELAQYMERVYTSNLRYDMDNGVDTVLPSTPCRNELSGSYGFAFASTPQARSYSIVATPQGSQATRDSGCGALSINQANIKGVSGTKPVSDCWR